MKIERNICKPYVCVGVVIVLVQSLIHVLHFMAPWSAAIQAFLSFISWNLLKLMSTEKVVPSKQLTLCHPYFLLP